MLWVLQGLAALTFGASGVMKVFLFDRIGADVPSFGALPRGAWMALGLLELVCTVGLIVPTALHWRPQLTVVAATLCSWQGSGMGAEWITGASRPRTDEATELRRRARHAAARSV